MSKPSSATPITAINEHPDGVCVSFAQAKTRDFDLVIGADGLHSDVRRLTFGPASDVEHYLGCLVAGASSRVIGPAMTWSTCTTASRADRSAVYAARGPHHVPVRAATEHAADPGELAARKALLRREFGLRRLGMPAHPGRARRCR